MTEPGFPFEAHYDAEAEHVPLDRRDLVVTLVIAAIGALLVGTVGVIAALELRISPDDLGPIALTGLGPFAGWLVGAAFALAVLARRRKRAWLPMLLGVAAGIVFAVIGVVWWLAVAHLI